MKPFSVLLSIVALSAISSSAAQKPDLTGTILTDTGKPLANATVFIYTAGPKVGVGTL